MRFEDNKLGVASSLYWLSGKIISYELIELLVFVYPACLALVTRLVAKPLSVLMKRTDLLACVKVNKTLSVERKHIP